MEKKKEWCSHLFDPLVVLERGVLGGGGRSALHHFSKAACLSQHGREAVHAPLLIRLLILQAAPHVWSPLSIPAALTGALKGRAAQVKNVSVKEHVIPSLTNLVIKMMVKWSLFIYSFVFFERKNKKECVVKKQNLSFIHTSMCWS